MTRAFAPSPAQQAFFDWVEHGTGSCVLEAVAGAGKTTTVLEGIARMRGRVWFGVFNKKMADEIKAKISERDDLRTRSGLYTSTFHGAGYKALLFFAKRKGVRVDVNDYKVADIADALIAEKEGTGQLLRHDLRDLRAAVVETVSMAKQRGIGALVPADDVGEWRRMIETYDLDQKLPDGANLDTLATFARAALCRSNKQLDVVDFDDMVYLPIQRNLRLLQHEWVLVDEAQDTNPTRRALARKLLAPGGRLVAVGDPHQAIYGFTGADNDSLEQLARDFGAQRMPLTVTYRCPKVVVEHARTWVSHITAHDTAPDGELDQLAYAELPAILANGVDRRETAVLCRYNRYLVELCFRLIRAGVPAKIEGRAIGEGLVKLATRWKRIKTLTALEDKLEEHREREVRKALDKRQEDKADRIDDQVATVRALIVRARAHGVEDVEGLVELIRSMFDDDVSEQRVVTLCSVHKSKGLEWDTVYLLGREELMPSAFARQAWQLDQETNLIYVAVTRAKRRLVEIYGLSNDDEGGEQHDAAS